MGFKKGIPPYQHKIECKCHRCTRTSPKPFKKGNVPWNKGKTHLAGDKHWNWKGGREKTIKGYIQLTLRGYPNSDSRGRILEHRVIMENILGRYLKKGEVVHHINGVRDDNRPGNLKLYKSNGEHISDELGGRTPKFIPSHKGYKHSEESKRIIGLKSKGRIPWNKGKRSYLSSETRKK